MSDEHTVESTAEAATTEATNAEAPDNGSASTDEPVVICDGVHVRYKTLATGKKLKLGGGGGMLKRQRGIQEVHALKGVSFVAHRNESIGVIGTNGSGKSTLMRSITGLTPTSEGTIYAKSRPNLLGVGAALIPDLSGARNIVIGSLALGSRARRWRRSSMTSSSSPGSRTSSTCPCARTPRGCPSG
jgi:teichoic acid transport system ATP-binding protein